MKEKLKKRSEDALRYFPRNYTIIIQTSKKKKKEALVHLFHNY